MSKPNTKEDKYMGELSYRGKLYRWIIIDVINHPDGLILPSWIMFIYAILFPLKYFYYRISKGEGYQVESDTWKIHGYTFSSEFFIHLAYGGDDSFKIVSRDNGIITVKKE